VRFRLREPATDTVATLGIAVGAYAELRNQVTRFIAGGPLLALRKWIESYDKPISESDDVRCCAPVSDAYALISEGDLGARSEASIRSALVASQRLKVDTTSPTLDRFQATPWSDRS
jgi:hypothetical protein